MTKPYSKKKVNKPGDPDFAASVTVSLPRIYWDAITLLYTNVNRSNTVRAVFEANPLFMEQLKKLRGELE